MHRTLILTAAAALLGVPFLSAQSTVDVTVTATDGQVDLGPGFATETAKLYGGQLPGPTIRVTQGQRLRVRFLNQLMHEETTVHWHGQPVPLGQDGMAGISRTTVAPGQEHLYELDNLQPGTYWYHPHGLHHHEQLDSGMYGVLIVDPANPGDDPPYDIEQTIVLDDWLQPFGGAYYGHLLNGRTSLGQAPIVVQPGQRLRLRILNVAATTNYAIALDGHPMTVTHADGTRIQPVTVQCLPIGIGERWDVIVDCNNPGVWSLAASTLQNRYSTIVRGVIQYAGQTGPAPAPTFVPNNLRIGSLLSYAQLASFLPSPLTATPARTVPAVLGMQMNGSTMTWTINGEAWPQVTPMTIARGDVVQIDMSNPGTTMSMFHPMHLHGHSFRLMGTAGGSTHAPLKDTVLINRSGQPGSSASVQFTADNPGRWMFHCHDMMHMMNGMIGLFDYMGDDDGDGLPDHVDRNPTLATPVIAIPEDHMAFVPGASDVLSVQWQPGQWVDFLASLTDAWPPIAMAPWGNLYLQPGTITALGTAVVQADGHATLPYSIPNEPALAGLRMGLQALTGTSLPHTVRLSTYQALSVR